MRHAIFDQKYHFFSFFNSLSGGYMRTGIIDSEGKDTGVDPFMASFPHLIDVGIMGHCIHGRSGLCEKAGVACYQNGPYAEESNMELNDFQWIAEQCRGRTYQFALGGRGDPDQHEHFAEILQICHENQIVPNFTTSGYRLTEELAAVCKKYCGAVAVSWYHNSYTLHIEDRYLTASDAKMWKEQLVRGGIHATSVIRHLLGRRDREYFKIANIGLLFDTMDDMLLDMGMYTGFICQMFAIGTKRRGSLVKYGEGKVCAYDKFLSALNAILKHSNCQYVLRRIDFFRLSVYLYELFPQGTDEIWDIFFSQHPALALSLLKEMFEHPRSLIRDNVADILSNLRALHGNDPELASFDLSSYEREVSQQFRTICSQISEIFD